MLFSNLLRLKNPDLKCDCNVNRLRWSSVQGHLTQTQRTNYFLVSSFPNHSFNQIHLIWRLFSCSFKGNWTELPDSSLKGHKRTGNKVKNRETADSITLYQKTNGSQWLTFCQTWYLLKHCQRHNGPRVSGIESVTWIYSFSARIITNRFLSQIWFKLETQ